jgi:peptidoglycan/LPS O-acetylase OafA/YrhL
MRYRVWRRLVLGVAVAASVWVFLAVDSGSHSISDTLYGSVVPIGLVWLAALAVVLVLGRTMADP